MIYTNIDNLKLNTRCKNYNALGDSFKEWIFETTVKLYNGRTKYEDEAASILDKLNENYEPQCFFFDSSTKKSYFLDFLLIDKKIALEIDGGYHLLNKEYDKDRDKFFKSIGIKTIRVKNENTTFSYIQNVLYPKLNNRKKLTLKENADKVNFENQINSMIKKYNSKYNKDIKHVVF